MSRSSESTSYMMTLSVNASGDSDFSFSARISSSFIWRSTSSSLPMKQHSCPVSGQASPTPRPRSTASALHSA